MTIELMAKMIALVNDIFFTAKIAEIARQCGSAVEFAAEEKTLLEMVRLSRPDIVAVDLSMKGIDILALPRKIKSVSPETEVIGFLAHVQAELKQQAEKAGYKVYTRSKFFDELAGFLQIK